MLVRIKCENYVIELHIRIRFSLIICDTVCSKYAILFLDSVLQRIALDSPEFSPTSKLVKEVISLLKEVTNR